MVGSTVRAAGPRPTAWPRCAKRRERGAAHEVDFQLDRWRKVVELVDTTTLAGFRTVGEALETGEQLTPPPRTPIDDKLDG